MLLAGVQLAEKEEFDHQLKDLEKVCMPIITKLYQGAGGMPEGGMPGGFPGAGGTGGGWRWGQGGQRSHDRGSRLSTGLADTLHCPVNGSGALFGEKWRYVLA